MSKAQRLQPRQSRTCILVLGMRRSGTSALGGVLSKLGCDLPATPMAASKSNAKGFFESVVVRDFNDELLASAGSSWDDLTPFHEEWMTSPQGRIFLDRALSILESEFGESQLFVLKDPRICRLVPFWTQALEDFGSLLRPILTIRNPLDVGRSLLNKRGMSEPVGQMLWLRHVLDAERATRGMLRFHTSFEQLMQGWEGVAEQAERALQLKWPKNIASVEFEVAKFLSRDLQHHKDAPSRTLTSALLPEWLREAYAILNRWAESGEAAEDFPKLDRIKGEFDAASAAFARVVRAEREITAEQKAKSEEAAEATRTLQTELGGVIATLKEQRAGLEKALQTEKTASETKRTALTQSLEQERAERKQERKTLERDLEQQRAAVERSRAALDEERAKRMELRSTLSQSLEAERIARKQERKSLERTVEQLRAAIEAGRSALESERRTSKEERAALETRLEQERRTVEAAEQRSAEAEIRLTELQSELESVRTHTAQEIGQLKSLLQEQRRRATLMDAELYQLKDAREALEFELAETRQSLERQLSEARAETAESRARRKEAARVIARRDAEIQARFQELAILERHILESSLSWRIRNAVQRLSGTDRPRDPQPAS